MMKKKQQWEIHRQRRTNRLIAFIVICVNATLSYIWGKVHVRLGVSLGHAVHTYSGVLTLKHKSALSCDAENIFITLPPCVCWCNYSVTQQWLDINASYKLGPLRRLRV